jgi:thymidylate synthase (FAD)
MIKVKLIGYTKDPEQNVTAAIRQCYSPVGANEIKKKVDAGTIERLIKQVIGSGHTSTIEHASFTFAIEGVSRALTHQLVRHRMASYSHQSQRYVDLSKDKLNYITPPMITNNKEIEKEYKKTMKLIETQYKKMIELGIKPEDARYILPNACETKIVVTMNARSLHNFFRERCCSRAQWEIRQLAGLMLKEVRKIAPVIFRNVGPTCETEKICWEGKMSCGKYKTIKNAQLLSRI